MDTESHEKLVDAENNPELVPVILAGDSSTWLTLDGASILFVQKDELEEAKITGAVPKAVLQVSVKELLPEWGDVGG